MTLIAAVGPGLPYRHAVFCDGAGFVHTEHRHGPQRFHRRQFPDKGVLFGKAPRTHREENGQNHREFLGDHGHRQGDARQDAFDQPAFPGKLRAVGVGDQAD
ncbi:hypothetical protein SDC9_176983 [bioreactor metagenome]|uniref:Uncharacterized protein n=1 Tax=bioreactor metagenome TaxID=1076179 RepID=A0A645GTB3_9ZZZZ